MRPVAFVIEILTLHKGLVQATPSTRTLELRVADITISSVPTQHAQQQGWVWWEKLWRPSPWGGLAHVWQGLCPFHVVVRRLLTMRLTAFM